MRWLAWSALLVSWAGCQTFDPKHPLMGKPTDLSAGPGYYGVTEEAQSALELQALQRVIASGARALDLEVVLDRCLEQAIAVARSDGGTLYLRDAKRGTYRLAASRNSADFSPTLLDVEERLPS